MKTSSIRLTALTMILAAVGFAVSLTGCVGTAGIAPAGDSTLDDVLSRGLAASPRPAVVVPGERPELDVPGRRLVVASAR
jgi:hypothetical protein